MGDVTSGTKLQTPPYHCLCCIRTYPIQIVINCVRSLELYSLFQIMDLKESTDFFVVARFIANKMIN